MWTVEWNCAPPTIYELDEYSNAARRPVLTDTPHGTGSIQRVLMELVGVPLSITLAQPLQ